jgi:hypothetical protein
MYIYQYNIDFNVYDCSHFSKDSSLKKLTHLSKTLMDEQDWYEKDLNDFEEQQSSIDNSPVEQPFIRPKKKQISVLENDYCGRNYPIDIWYLIAMYIAPEDIGRFALICQATNQVVNTVAFWISIFRK